MSVEFVANNDSNGEIDPLYKRRQILRQLAEGLESPMQIVIDAEILIDNGENDLSVYHWTKSELKSARELRVKYNNYLESIKVPDIADATVVEPRINEESIAPPTVEKIERRDVTESPEIPEAPSSDAAGETKAPRVKRKVTRTLSRVAMPENEMQRLVQEDIELDRIVKERKMQKQTAVEVTVNQDLDGEIANLDPVRQYLNQIGKTALLNAGHEVGLAKRIEAGLFATQLLAERDKMAPEQRRELQFVVRQGDDAKSHLVEANLRLVVSLAKRYTGRGMPLLDLIQEGNLGLIRAMEKFDYTKGFKFSTYATWWIRQAITRGMADQGRSIRLPVHMVEVVNKISRIERELLQELNREPTPEEVAHEAGLTVEKLIEIKGYSREPISLNQGVGSEEDAELGDFIEDSEGVNAIDVVTFSKMQGQIEAVLETLSEREAGVIRLRFGLTDGNPRTLDEIGKIYGVTRERIRQIEGKTMSMLRHPSRSQHLRDYLD